MADGRSDAFARPFDPPPSGRDANDSPPPSARRSGA